MKLSLKVKQIREVTTEKIVEEMPVETKHYITTLQDDFGNKVALKTGERPNGYGVGIPVDVDFTNLQTTIDEHDEEPGAGSEG